MATKTKIAHPKRAPKRTTKTAEKPMQGRTLGEILAERLTELGVKVPPPKAEQPLPDGLIDRAAARLAPTIPPPVDPAIDAAEEAERDRITAAIGPRLILACDQLCEEIAAIADSAGGAGRGGTDHNVVDALLSIWKIRWELGLTPNEVAKARDEAEGSEQGSEVAS